MELPKGHLFPNASDHGQVTRMEEMPLADVWLCLMEAKRYISSPLLEIADSPPEVQLQETCEAYSISPN